MSALHRCWFFVLGFLFLLGCTPSDDERCRKGFYFEMNFGCLPVDSGTGTDTEEEDGGFVVVDGGEEGGPTGIGVTCEDDTQCEGYDADYCSKDPTKPELDGVCVIKDCAGNPGKCPADLGLECCGFNSFDLPSMCVPPEVIAEIGAMVGC
jgi:hypothetical protein